MVPIILPDDTPLWVEIIVAGIVIASLIVAIRHWRRTGRF